MNQTITAGSPQNIVISASDDTHLVAGGGGLGVSTGGSGVGVGLYVAVIDKDTRAYIGKGANVKAAGDITINAVRSERILAFAATIGVGGDGVGVAASIIVVILDPNAESGMHSGTRAYVDSTSAEPTTVRAGGNFTIFEALDGQEWPDVLGTIGGENTILVICRSAAAREKVEKRLLKAAKG